MTTTTALLRLDDRIRGLIEEMESLAIEEPRSLGMMVDIHIQVQKARVATGNRVAHLERASRTDRRVEVTHLYLQRVEEVLELLIASEWKAHPAHPWVSRISGCGDENAAKVIGIIEDTTFSGALYEDLRAVGAVSEKVEGEETKWVPLTLADFKDRPAELEQEYPALFRRRSGIYAFDTISKLRRYAGLAVIDGQVERRRKGGGKIHYNSELRVMLWRLMTSLMRAGGKWYQKYLEDRRYYEWRIVERDGMAIRPTPPGRFCAQCQEEKQVPKTTHFCPDCDGLLSGKKEPPGIYWEGHVEAMARRRTIRLWLDCLWLVWREALGLPTRSPWIEEYGQHTGIISPREMVDR